MTETIKSAKITFVYIEFHINISIDIHSVVSSSFSFPENVNDTMKNNGQFMIKTVLEITKIKPRYITCAYPYVHRLLYFYIPLQTLAISSSSILIGILHDNPISAKPLL